MNLLKISVLFSLFFQSIAWGIEFKDISLNGWKKEEIANDHLRFIDPISKMVIHLQVDSFDRDNQLNEKNLDSEMKFMTATRKKMSSIMGLDNYQIHSYKFVTNSAYPTLKIFGSYVRFKKEKIHFSEYNFYHNNKFLQVKVISEEKILSEEKVEQLMSKIKPEDVRFD